MMPAFSREALRRLAWTFHETVSGFGVDLLWGQTLATEREAGRIAVIGNVPRTAREGDRRDRGRLLRLHG